MELRTLIDNTRTYKDTLHSYLETLEKLFKEIALYVKSNNGNWYSRRRKY
jgi:hypothetical protein